MKKWLTVFADAPRGGKMGVCNLADRTIRFDTRINAAGESIRLCFGNRYGSEPMKIGGVTVWNGKQGGRITFSGSNGLFLAVGEEICSDSLCLSIHPGDLLRVLVYFTPDCPVPRSVSATWATVHSQPGDFTDQPDFIPADDALRDPFPFPLPEPLPGLTAIDLYTDSDAKAVLAFGDSITEFKTWTDPLTSRLLEERTGKMPFLNLGIGGNRMLLATTPGFAELAGNMFGEAGIDRAEWDIFGHFGVGCVLFALGINDVSQPGSNENGPPISERVTTADFTKAVEQLAVRLHNAGIRIIGCAITPFGGMGGCCDETMNQRLEINQWMQRAAENGLLDGYVDFASAVEDPDKPGYLLPEYDCGDHLHPSPKGGAQIAAAFPIEILDY